MPGGGAGGNCWGQGPLVLEPWSKEVARVGSQHPSSGAGHGGVFLSSASSWVGEDLQ
jgi:hypothetical protein